MTAPTGRGDRLRRETIQGPKTPVPLRTHPRLKRSAFDPRATIREGYGRGAPPRRDSSGPPKTLDPFSLCVQRPFFEIGVTLHRRLSKSFEPDRPQAEVPGSWHPWFVFRDGTAPHPYGPLLGHRAKGLR